MKRILLTLLTLASLATVSTKAGLGWTMEEAKQHYGEPVPYQHPLYGQLFRYTYNGQTIKVGFQDNIVISIQYEWTEKPSLEVIDSLLEENKQEGSKWDLNAKTYGGENKRWLAFDENNEFTTWAGFNFSPEDKTYWLIIQTAKEFWKERVEVPDLDFTGQSAETLRMLASYDARLYLEKHPNLKATSDRDLLPIGQAHAVKHHLTGSDISVYALEFVTVVQGLTSKD